MVNSPDFQTLFFDVLGFLFASLFEGLIIYGAIKMFLLVTGKKADFADTRYFSKTGKLVILIILIIGGIVFGFFWYLGTIEILCDFFSL